MSHYDCPCMEKCPLHWAMSRIGGKWKVQILCSVANAGTIRYNALRAKLDGISNTVLSAALRELEGTAWGGGRPIRRCRCGWSTAPRSAACACCRCWRVCPTGPRRRWTARKKNSRNRGNF